MLTRNSSQICNESEVLTRCVRNTDLCCLFRTLKRVKGPRLIGNGTCSAIYELPALRGAYIKCNWCISVAISFTVSPYISLTRLVRNSKQKTHNVLTRRRQSQLLWQAWGCATCCSRPSGPGSWCSQGSGLESSTPGTTWWKFGGKGPERENMVSILASEARTLNPTSAGSNPRTRGYHSNIGC